MNASDLKIRRNKILEAIIDAHVDTALPVGSFAISHRLRVSLSPATIRNIMAELEELGYIWQPHTSAGRVPTDKGYRYYVDTLMEAQYLTKDEEEEIGSRYEAKKDTLEKIVEETSKVLSIVTHCAGLALFPKVKRELFKRVELILVEPKKVLAVLVSSSGLVRNSTIPFEGEIEESELQRVSQFLNQEFKGKTIGEIESHLERQLLMEQHSFFYILKRALEIVHSSAVNTQEDKLYLEGASHILEQPEFNNTERVKPILRALEERCELLEIMNRDLEEGKIAIHIGSESGYEDIQECSLVISPYTIGNCSIGTLGIIGSKRMLYSKVVPVVRFISQIVGQLIGDLE